ncbi:hypothetical protein [Tropicimonas sp. IMCC34043]|uniref:hypothetical protein n=1 Tax=Tropicimonas sp. IMCC34043 TaxID=2248760 RepID=UPI0013007F00|nr:hypothetical protein [Tropicimonas sp. IMCC34043]
MKHIISALLHRKPAIFASPLRPGPDPIDHPVLRRMSPRELADLPMPRPEPAQRPGCCRAG